MVAPGLTLRRARALRAVMTPPEAALWRALRSRGVGGLRFRRQHPIGPWIVDFYCAEVGLAVEVDGESHAMGDPGRDTRRDADLDRRGVRVLRVAACDVLREIDGVLITIQAAADAATVPPG